MIIKEAELIFLGGDKLCSYFVAIQRLSLSDEEKGHLRNFFIKFWRTILPLRRNAFCHVICEFVQKLRKQDPDPSVETILSLLYEQVKVETTRLKRNILRIIYLEDLDTLTQLSLEDLRLFTLLGR